jgi:hypothetical protein
VHQDGYKPGDEKTLESKIGATLNATPAAPGSAPALECQVRP